MIIIADTSFGPKCIYICSCTNQTPWTENPAFCKADRFLSPNNTWTVQIIRTLVYCFRKIMHHIWWIQRLGIILTVLLVVLTFLNFVRQWKGFKMRPLCAPEIPPHYRHTVVVQTVSTLEGLHCIPVWLDPHIWSVVLSLRAGLTRHNVAG